MSYSNQHPARPRLACEIASDRVLAGRVSESTDVVEAYSSAEIAPGSLAPDLTESNVQRQDALAEALRSALESITARGRDVVMVIPDATVRVVLLDFDTLPAKAHEAEAVVRFRLKKSLPYDVDKAKISYHAQPAKEGGIKVVAAVVLAHVLEEYEAAVRLSGFSPGVVVPSMLASLGAVDATRPSLAVKVDSRTTSIAIMDGGQLLLFRTLENARGQSLTGEQLAEEVYPSIVFFQDTYHLNLERIYVAGLPESAGAATALRAQTGAEVHDLVAASQLGENLGSPVPRWRMAGVVGALVS
jgi:type IV pilus assembly protein PilM